MREKSGFPVFDWKIYPLNALELRPGAYSLRIPPDAYSRERTTKTCSSTQMVSEPLVSGNSNWVKRRPTWKARVQKVRARERQASVVVPRRLLLVAGACRRRPSDVVSSERTGFMSGGRLPSASGIAFDADESGRGAGRGRVETRQQRRHLPGRLSCFACGWIAALRRPSASLPSESDQTQAA